MARARACTGGILYLGGVDHHMVYDAVLWNKTKKKNLFSLFIGRILFQLYYTICEWWTANAGILYEKEKHIYSSFCGYSDDHYDHL